MILRTAEPLRSIVGRARPCRRTPAEVVAIAAAGEVVADALEVASGAAVPGVSTAELARLVAEVLERRGAEAILREQVTEQGEGFPACCCTSVNEVAIHGVPGDRSLVDGDLLSIDVACRLEGWCADAATTVGVGRLDPSRRRLLEVGRGVLAAAIGAVVPGRRWSEVASIMQDRAEQSGFACLAGFCGHGIGRSLHEPPAVPSLVSARLVDHEDFTLVPGMVFTIEPVVVLQSAAPRDGRFARGVGARPSGDGWGIEVASGSPSCHFEHTVAVTPTGAVVLSKPGAATAVATLAARRTA